MRAILTKFMPCTIADLQNAYDMIHGRKNKGTLSNKMSIFNSLNSNLMCMVAEGRFSLEERDRLIDVIRKHYKVDGD